MAGVAAFDTTRSGDPAARTAEPPAAAPERERLEGPDVPAPSTLAGTLLLAEREGCRIRTVDLPTSSLEPAPGPVACAFWTGPGGAPLILALDRERRGDVAAIALAAQGPDGQTAWLGRAVGEVAFAPDGATVAWCGPDGGTTVLGLAGGRAGAVPGCDPRFAADGSVLTRPLDPFDTTILADGAPFLGREALAEGLPPDAARPVGLLGYDVRGDLLAVALVGIGDAGFVQALGLWRGREHLRTVELVRAPVAAVVSAGGFGLGGKLVRLGPGGDEAVLGGRRGRGPLVLVDLRTGQRLPLPGQSGFDWSPDGRWLALATADGVLVFGHDRTAHAYALPLVAESIAWRP